MQSLEELKKGGEELFDTEFYNIGEDSLSEIQGNQLKYFLNQRTTLAYEAGEKAMLEKVLEMIDYDRVELRDKEDHLPNVYQYLKGKNDLRDVLKYKLSTKE